jgi:hypothetical protein
MRIDPNDVYFGLVCLASMIVLALLLGFFMDYIEKDRNDE